MSIAFTRPLNKGYVPLFRHFVHKQQITGVSSGKMRHFRIINKRLGQNWKAMVSFVILYKLFTSALIFPAFSMLFNRSLEMAGLKYLTAENLSVFLHSPIPFITLGILLLLYVVLQLFDIIGIIYIFDQSRHNFSVSVGQVILFAARRTIRVFRPWNLIILPILLFLTPLLHLATLFNLFWSYSISERILRLLTSNRYVLVVVLVIIFLSVYAFFRWMYVFHYYALQKCRGLESLDNSTNLWKKTHTAGRILGMLKVQVFLVIVYFLLLVAVLTLSTVAKMVFRLSGGMVSTFQVVFITLTVSLFDTILLPYTFGCISELFYSGKKMISEPIPTTPYFNEKKNVNSMRRIRVLEVVVFALSITVGSIYLLGLYRGRFAVRAERLKTMQVTAHRGASMFYPENTMAAFVGAVEQGADWIELDVQESGDGVIYVMHDSNFKRTCGEENDVYAWETGWDRISGMDAGSFYSEDFAGEPVPLLQDVIRFAKEVGVRLNIEIKPTGYEKDLVGSVVRIVEEEDFIHDCVVTSQSYSAVSKVKEINPEIMTVYVTGVAYGSIAKLKDADAFSIKSTSITRALVRSLHRRGKEVYAWTVDSRRNINRMIDLGVDNIITNNIPLAIECINDSRTGTLLVELRKMVRDLF